MKQLIILGNGFDLACGLKSSYYSFFFKRFRELFSQRNSNTFEELENELNVHRMRILYEFSDSNQEIRLNLNSYQNFDYFEYIKNKYYSKYPNLTRWDILFLFADLCVDKRISNYRWQDVESLIFDVVSIALNKLEKDGNYKLPYVKTITIGNENWSGTDFFSKIIFKVLSTKNNTIEKIASNLLIELKKFENDFANYIADQINLNQTASGYVYNSCELFRNISRFYESINDSCFIDEIDVLSFNYSLDERFLSILNDNRVKSWSNIHGIACSKDPNLLNTMPWRDDYLGPSILPAPIFGIDNHDIINDRNNHDLRTVFTKSYRVIANNVNGIRNTNGYSDPSLISIYGHSLGSADYSYFEAIFDECDLYNSDVKIEYFYYSGEGQEIKVQRKQDAISRIYDLLTHYGLTLSEAHGMGIVNRLNLENRLSVVPMEVLQEY